MDEKIRKWKEKEAEERRQNTDSSKSNEDAVQRKLKDYKIDPVGSSSSHANDNHEKNEEEGENGADKESSNCEDSVQRKLKDYKIDSTKPSTDRSSISSSKNSEEGRTNVDDKIRKWKEDQTGESRPGVTSSSSDDAVQSKLKNYGIGSTTSNSQNSGASGSNNNGRDLVRQKLRNTTDSNDNNNNNNNNNNDGKAELRGLSSMVDPGNKQQRFGASTKPGAVFVSPDTTAPTATAGKDGRSSGMLDDKRAPRGLASHVVGKGSRAGGTGAATTPGVEFISDPNENTGTHAPANNANDNAAGQNRGSLSSKIQALRGLAAVDAQSSNQQRPTNAVPRSSVSSPSEDASVRKKGEVRGLAATVSSQQQVPGVQDISREDESRGIRSKLGLVSSSPPTGLSAQVPDLLDADGDSIPLKGERAASAAPTTTAQRDGFSTMTSEHMNTMRAKTAEMLGSGGVIGRESERTDYVSERARTSNTGTLRRNRDSEVTNFRRTGANANLVGSRTPQNRRDVDNVSLQPTLIGSLNNEEGLRDSRNRLKPEKSIRNLKNLKLRDVCSIKGILIFTFLVLVITGSFTVLLLDRRNQDKQNLQFFKEDLITNNFAQQAVLNDPQSFQSKALNFVDELGVLEFQLYLLVAFVYGIEGSSKVSSTLLENNVDWCEWSWVECIIKSVSGIILIDKDLDGTIVSEIKDLTELKHLNLGSNNLEGTIPMEIGSLKKLETLILEKNKFEGSTPKNIWNLTNLVTLDLNGNFELQGTIHTTIAKMTNLNYLDISNCALEGPIPSEISLLSNVKVIFLSGNPYLESTITEIAGLKKLKKLDLSNSRGVAGPIPDLTQMGQLEELNLRATSISGTIPNVGNAVKLKHFLLGDTKLKGTIPTEFGDLNKLEIFDVHNTNVEGTIPTEFGRLRHLENLDVELTSVSGIIPAELGSLKNLIKLDFCHTDLKGALPSDLCDNSDTVIFYDGSCACCKGCFFS